MTFAGQTKWLSAQMWSTLESILHGVFFRDRKDNDWEHVQ